jgi:hypothetical protein
LEKLAKLKEEEDRKKREDEERFKREEEEKIKREEEEKAKREEEAQQTLKVVGFEVKDQTVLEHKVEVKFYDFFLIILDGKFQRR